MICLCFYKYLGVREQNNGMNRGKRCGGEREKERGEDSGASEGPDSTKYDEREEMRGEGGHNSR